MKTRKNKTGDRPVLIELLESRTLLASGLGELGSFSDQLSWVNTAVDGSNGHDVSVDLSALDSMLVIRGDGSGSITINTDLLPTTVSNLHISSFSEVTLTGSHALAFLKVEGINDLSIQHISFTADLHVSDVANLTVDKMPQLTILTGDRTLVQSRDFSQSTIFSSLTALGLSSPEGVQNDLTLISWNAQQLVFLDFEFATEKAFGVVGFQDQTSQIGLVKGGSVSTALFGLAPTGTDPFDGPISVVPVKGLFEYHDWSQLQQRIEGLGDTGRHLLASTLAAPQYVDELSRGSLVKTGEQSGATIFGIHEAGHLDDAKSDPERAGGNASDILVSIIDSGPAGGTYVAQTGVEGQLPADVPASLGDMLASLNSTLLQLSGTPGEAGSEDNAAAVSSLFSMDGLPLASTWLAQLDEAYRGFGDLFWNKLSDQFEASERAVLLVESKPFRTDEDIAR